MIRFSPSLDKVLEPKREFKVGDRVTVSLPSGRVVEATVKAVINRTHGVRLQVDYGKDETALVYVRLMMAFTTPLNDPTCRQADRHAVADFERFIWIL